MAERKLDIKIVADGTQAKAELERVKTAAASVAPATNKIAPVTDQAKKGIAAVGESVKAQPSLFNRMTEQLNRVRDAGRGVRTAFHGSPIGQFLSPVAAIGAVAAVAIQALSVAWTGYLERLRAGADRARENVAQLAKLRELSESRRQSDLQSMAALQRLSSMDQLSTVQKRQQIELVNRLATSYSGLGVAINDASGKVSGLDGAMAAMLEQQRQRQIGESKRIIKQLETQYNELGVVETKSGSFISKLITQDHGSNTLGAAKERSSIGDKLSEERAKYRDLLRQSPGKDIQLENDSSIENARQLLEVENLRAKGQTEAADKMAWMIANQERLLKFTTREKDELYEINRATEKRKKLTDDIAAAEEKARAEQQADIRARAEAADSFYGDAMENAQFELAILQAKKAGNADEIARLELEKEMRDRGANLEADQIDAILAKRKAISDLQSGKSVKDGVQNLDQLQVDSLARIGGYSMGFNQTAAANTGQVTNSLLREIKSAILQGQKPRRELA